MLAFSWPHENQRNPALPGRVGDTLGASWLDSSTLQLEMITTAQPEWPVQLGLHAALVGDLRSPLQNAPPSRSAATLVSPVMPMIVSAIASDADNADALLGIGDKVRIEFDRPARPPASATSGDAAFVRGFFEFSHPLGGGYSGAWLNAWVFEITILNATSGAAVPAPYNLAHDGSAHVLPHSLPAVTSNEWLPAPSAAHPTARTLIP